MTSKLTNPGGSLGEIEFPVTFDIYEFSEIKKSLINNHGYETSTNLFSRNYLSGKVVAEMGCGHGFMTLLLSEFAAKVDAYDVDGNAIRFAEKMRDKLGVPNIDFFSYDGTSIPNKEGYYDCVISSDVIEHIPEPLTYLRLINKILKVGGILYLATPNGLIANKNKCIISLHSKYHVTEYFPDELSEMLRSSGFRLIDSFSNKNISGGGYHMGLLKKTVIKVLCKIGLFYWVQQMKDNLGGCFGFRQTRNSVSDFKITPIKLDEITQKNCDVIILVAQKTVN
ncbi:MAG: class I SAM-dependent methyltransferase [Nitrososphaerota archaeon]